MRNTLAKMSDSQLLEFVANAEQGGGWRSRMHTDAFGIVDEFSVSWISSVDRLGWCRGRLMVYYVVRYQNPMLGTRRGSVAIAKFPFFKRVPTTAQIERLVDAGYAVMEQRRSLAKAEFAEREAQYVAMRQAQKKETAGV